MIQMKFVEKNKTHVLYSIIFSKNHTIYEIMWKNLVQPKRPHDNTIWPMRFACWVSKATRSSTHTHTPTHSWTYPHVRTHMRARIPTHRNMLHLLLSTTAPVKRTRLNVTSHVHCLSCCYSFFSCVIKLNYFNVCTMDIRL